MTPTIVRIRVRQHPGTCADTCVLFMQITQSEIYSLYACLIDIRELRRALYHKPVSDSTFCCILNHGTRCHLAGRGGAVTIEDIASHCRYGDARGQNTYGYFTENPTRH